MSATTPMPPEAERPRGPSFTAYQWYRLFQAFDAGAPPLLACQYAGVRFETWLAKCRCMPEVEQVAQRMRSSGAVACLMFLQQTAATDVKVASEFLKVAFAEHFGTARTREVPAAELVGDDDLEAEVSPDDVATVLRILRANGLGRSEVDRSIEVDGRRNGRVAGAGGDGEAAE